MNKTMTNEVPDFEKNLKSWFEANFLDGDLIQKGQMISSQECFRIACEAYLAGEKSGRKAQVKVDAEIARNYGEKFGNENKDKWTITHTCAGLNVAKAIESEAVGNI